MVELIVGAAILAVGIALGFFFTVLVIGFAKSIE